MTAAWDFATFAALYDRGRLVPFIGSGMSIGECVGWGSFVDEIERYAGLKEDAQRTRAVRPERPFVDPIRRAAAALRAMRCQGRSMGEAVRASVYAPTDQRRTTHSAALAGLYWPLVCTTNYDDVYLREAVNQRKAKPRVLGRSEDDCRRVLQHMAMPSGEVIWALQGFLTPRSSDLHGWVGDEPARLEPELVVGPVEYRQVTHRAPHFRRCFAEVFRHCSLLFLGSGLAEPYLLTLFDEIVELVGPPPRPHFALVPEGMLEPDFMLEHYHIVCRTYPRDDHEHVSRLITQLAEFVQGDRCRPRSWGYRLRTPSFVEAQHCGTHFEVVRAPLPVPSLLPVDEVLAISCGREVNSNAHQDKRGRPIPSHLIEGRVSTADQEPFCWLDDHWTVGWPKSDKRILGIVARGLIEDGVRSPRDARSPEAIRLSFLSFLDFVASRGASVAHVQLLASGKSKVFHPWVSLVQMARAYGQWFKNRPLKAPPLHVVLYVVAPDVVTLLSGGYLDLTEHLEGAQIRVSVEVIDFFGRVLTYYQLVDPSAALGSLSVFAAKSAVPPRVHVLPTPQLRSTPTPLDQIDDMQLRDFGLVSGSTLVVDYRQANSPG